MPNNTKCTSRLLHEMPKPFHATNSRLGQLACLREMFSMDIDKLRTIQPDFTSHPSLILTKSCEWDMRVVLKHSLLPYFKPWFHMWINYHLYSPHKHVISKCCKPLPILSLILTKYVLINHSIHISNPEFIYNEHGWSNRMTCNIECLFHAST